MKKKSEEQQKVCGPLIDSLGAPVLVAEPVGCMYFSSQPHVGITVWLG